MSQPNKGGIRKLFADWLALLRSWWRVDRIRVSPGEGRMLRLDAGSLILVRNRPVEIVGRRVQSNGSCVTIVYDCQGADGDAQLVVVSASEIGESLLSWIDGGRTEKIDETDVAIYR